MKITADDFIKNLESDDTTLAMLVTLKEDEEKYAVNVMIDDGVENASLRAVIAGILKTIAERDGGLEAVLASITLLIKEAQDELDLMEPAGVELWS